MHYIDLPGSNVQLSCIGFGTFPFDENIRAPIDVGKAVAIMQRAYELGITSYNTAPYYGGGRCEELLGDFLQTVRREDVLVTSKLGSNIYQKPPVSLDPAFMEESLQQILDRLRTDYLDICHLHAPDPATPLEESVAKMIDFQRRGLIRHIGMSKHTPTQIEQARQWASIDVLEFYYSMVTRDDADGGDALMNYATDNQIIATPFKVIERGLLTNAGVDDSDALIRRMHDTYKSPLVDSMHKPQIDTLRKKLQTIAANNGITLVQLVIARTLARGPYVSPLIGFREIEYVEEAVGALDVVQSDELEEQINEVLEVYHS